MRAVIIADADLAARERAMLSRLEVGLADEGVRVAHAAPRRTAEFVPSSVFAERLLYEDRGTPLSLSWRADGLSRAIAERWGDQSPADVVHVFGRGAWALAARVASRMGAALVVELDAVASVHARPRVAPPGAAALAVIAADPALALVGRMGDAAPVASWGVHAAAAAAPILSPGRAPSVFLLARGADRVAIDACLEGVAAAIARCPDAMLFVCPEAIRAVGLSDRLETLGLRERLTLAADMEVHRDLVVAGDVLVLAEPLGGPRTFVLDAMGHGMAVVAAADAASAALVDGVTARVVTDPSRRAWEEALGGVLGDAEGARRLGASAWSWVREHRRASDQVAAVLRAYDGVAPGEALPFAATRGG